MALPKELESVDWSIMPVRAILAMHRVIQNAIPSHGRDTWRHSTKGRRWSFQMAHARAHDKNFECGWDRDDDGELHLAHDFTRRAMALELFEDGTVIDDRPKIDEE